MSKKIILIFFITTTIIAAFSFFVASLPKLKSDDSEKQKLGEELLTENLQSNSDFPKISVSFVKDVECDAQRILRVKLTDVQKESILAISLIPEIDGIDAGTNIAKPIPPNGYCELHGLPLVRKIQPSGGTWDICYPSFVFDQNTYLPPDNRKVTGWIVRAYIVDIIAALPLSGVRTIGRLQTLTIGDLQNGAYLLGTEMEKEQFFSANFKVIVIPKSDSGVFFYVDKKKLLAWMKKEFDVDMQERTTY